MIRTQRIFETLRWWTTGHHSDYSDNQETRHCKVFPNRKDIELQVFSALSVSLFFLVWQLGYHRIVGGRLKPSKLWSWSKRNLSPLAPRFVEGCLDPTKAFMEGLSWCRESWREYHHFWEAQPVFQLFAMKWQWCQTLKKHVQNNSELLIGKEELKALTWRLTRSETADGRDRKLIHYREEHDGHDAHGEQRKQPIKPIVRIADMSRYEQYMSR